VRYRKSGSKAFDKRAEAHFSVDMTKTLGFLALSLITLAACGSDSETKTATLRPQINSAFVGTWRSDCIGAGDASVRHTVRFAGDGTLVSLDETYPNETCFDSPMESSSTPLAYGLISGAADQAQIIIRRSDSAPTGGDHWPERFQFVLSLHLVDPERVDAKLLAAGFRDENGQDRSLTEAEVAAVPVLHFARVSERVR
jgi:hypothetical protein